MTENKRLDWLDAAKGFGIILVIYAHIDNSLLRTLIYTFHVPLFFFLSGFVYSNAGSFKDFFLKKAKALIVPYFVYGIIIIIWQISNSTTPYTRDAFLELIKCFLVQNRMWTLWFIACLFCLNIIFYCVEHILKTTFKIGCFTFIFFISGILYYRYGGTSLPWNIDVCSMVLPFFFAGYICKKNWTSICKTFNTTFRTLSLLVLCCVINISLGLISLNISGQNVDIFYNQYGFIPLTYLSAISGIAAVIIISHKLKPKAIQYIGRNSLIYFALHQQIFIALVKDILKFIGIVLDKSWNQYQMVLYNTIITFLILILITLCQLVYVALKAGISSLIVNAS